MIPAIYEYAEKLVAKMPGNLKVSIIVALQKEIDMVHMPLIARILR